MRATVDGILLAEEVRRAETALSRFLGLMGRASLAPGHGLFIPKCGSIHMFFMRFPIDALFVDADNRVTRIHRNLRPWRIAFGGRGAVAVLELPAGAIPADVEDAALLGRRLVHT